MIRLRSDTGQDSGVFAILYGLLVVFLLGISALVVDLSFLRSDRDTDRSAADSAAVAGASVLQGGGPRAACLQAFSYAMSNLSGSATPDCSAFPATIPVTCPVAPIVASLTVQTVTIRVRWPVPDTDAAMLFPDVKPGNRTQIPVAADGDPLGCGRLAVSVGRPRQFSFATIWGFRQGSTTSTSVALQAPCSINQTCKGAKAIPLIVLDPASCNALRDTGGGGILVRRALVPDTVPPFGFAPGRIAVDSDGSGGDVNCTGGKTTLSLGGTTSFIHAQDGVAANGTTPGELAEIFSYALTAAGSNVNAYLSADVSGCVHSTTTVSGKLCPIPIAPANRVGEAPFNTLYNSQTDATKAYIDQFRTFATGAPGYPVFPGPTFPGLSCTTPSGGLTLIPGNVFVNCPGGLSIRNVTAFTGNVVIFNGDVRTSGTSCVLFGVPALLGTLATCNAPSTALLTYSANPETEVYIAGGLTVPTTIVAPQTFMLVSGRVNIGGSAHLTAPFGQTVTGTACTAGTAVVPPSASCFKNLVLWDDFVTDSSTAHNLSGGGGFLVDGVLYMPKGEFVFNGGPTANQTKAQFVAKRITVDGSGLLTMIPDASRQVLIELNAAILIR